MISLLDRRLASKQLKAALSSVGRQRLVTLVHDSDPMVATHATWEIAKSDREFKPQFLEKLDEFLNVPPPDWWADCVSTVVVYSGNCHYFPQATPLPHGQQIKTNVDQLTITASPQTAGFGFPLVASYSDTKDELWTAEVWAAGREILMGHGRHQLQILADSSQAYVYGVESHGLYAESFNLIDGHPSFRFSSCYWFKHSERWLN